MKAKNIILVGVGGIVGFVSCGVLTTKKILENDKMRNAVKQIRWNGFCMARRHNQRISQG